MLDDRHVEALRCCVREDPYTRLMIDLELQTVTARGMRFEFSIDPTRKQRLLTGLDDVGVTLEHRAAIESFEAANRARMPWLRTSDDS